MANSSTTTFRIIFTISDVSQELKMPNSSLKILLGETTKTVSLPCNKPVPLDFIGVNMNSKLEFDLEDNHGNIYGYSELAVPESAFKTRETQCNQTIHFYLNNSDKEFVTAKIFIIFLNTESLNLIKLKNPQGNGRPPVRSSSGHKRSNSQAMSTPKKKGETPKKTRQSEEKELHKHVDNLFNQYTQEFESLVKENNTVNSQTSFEHIADCSPIKQGSQNSHFLNTCPDTIFPASKEIKTLPDLSQDRSPIIRLQQTKSASISEVNEILPKDFSSSKLEPQANQENIFLRSESQKTITLDTEQGSFFHNQDHLPNFSSTAAAAPFYTEQASILHDDGDRLNRTVPIPIETIKIKSPTQNFASPAGSQGRYRDRSLEDSRLLSSTKKRQNSEVSSPDKKYAYGDITLYKAQIDQLQQKLLMKDSQLAVNEILKKENEDLKLALKKSEEARKSFQGASHETAQELKQGNQHLQGQISSLILDKDDLFKRNNELLGKIEELERKLTANQETTTAIEFEKFALGVEAKELGNVRQQLEKVQAALENSEQKRSEEKNSYMNSLQMCQQNVEGTKRIIERLTQEKKELSEEIFKVKMELVQEKNVSQSLRDELDLMNINLQNSEGHKIVIQNLENEKQDLIRMVFDKKKDHTEIQNLIEKVKDECTEKLREANKKEGEYLNQMGQLRIEIKGYEENKGELIKEIEQLKLRISELITEEVSLGQLASLNKDVEQQLGLTNEKLSQALEDKQKLNEHIILLSQSQDSATFRLLESERNASDLRTYLAEKDELIDSLRRVVAELRDSQSNYVPHKDDPIDFALARFINTRNDPGKLKRLFIREHRGVYQFGTKKIYVKVEADKIIIRVGGGFLTIEEFLEQYLHTEIEKLTRTGQYQSLAMSIVTNKTLAEKCVHQFERSKSEMYKNRDISPLARRMSGGENK